MADQQIQSNCPLLVNYLKEIASSDDYLEEGDTKINQSNITSLPRARHLIQRLDRAMMEMLHSIPSRNQRTNRYDSNFPLSHKQQKGSGMEKNFYYNLNDYYDDDNEDVGDGEGDGDEEEDCDESRSNKFATTESVSTISTTTNEVSTLDNNTIRNSQNISSSSSLSPQTIEAINTLAPLFHYILSHPYNIRKNQTMKDGTRLTEKDEVFLFTPCCYEVVKKSYMNKIRRTYHAITDAIGTHIRPRVSIDEACLLFNRGVETAYSSPGLQLALQPFFENRYYRLRVVDNNASSSSSCCISRDEEGEEKSTIIEDEVNDTRYSFLTVTSGTVQSLDEIVFGSVLKEHHEASVAQSIAVKNLCQRLESAVRHSALLSGATFTAYGSFLSGLVLAKSDIDISVYVPNCSDLTINSVSSSSRRKQVSIFLSDLKHHLRRAGFLGLEAITKARIPVLKGCLKQQDRDQNFDICIMNQIAVSNSLLIGQYADLDERVKTLMLVVKKWVQARNIGSPVDGTLSMYGWVNLVIFYLQCINFVPNLQCKELMKAHGVFPCKSDFVNEFDISFLQAQTLLRAQIWKRPEELEHMPVIALLYGFFTFYAYVFPRFTTAVSIRLGKCGLLKTAFSGAQFWRLCIEDPFETLNSGRHHDLGSHLRQKGYKKIQHRLKMIAQRMESAFQELVRSEEENTKTFYKLARMFEPDYDYKRSQRKPKKIKNPQGQYKNCGHTVENVPGIVFPTPPPPAQQQQRQQEHYEQPNSAVYFNQYGAQMPAHHKGHHYKRVRNLSNSSSRQSYKHDHNYVANQAYNQQQQHSFPRQQNYQGSQSQKQHAKTPKDYRRPQQQQQQRQSQYKQQQQQRHHISHHHYQQEDQQQQYDASDNQKQDDNINQEHLLNKQD